MRLQRFLHTSCMKALDPDLAIVPRFETISSLVIPMPESTIVRVRAILSVTKWISRDRSGLVSSVD